MSEVTRLRPRYPRRYERCGAWSCNTWGQTSVTSQQTPQQQQSGNNDNHEITSHVPGHLHNCGGGVYAEKPVSASKNGHLKVGGWIYFGK